MEKKCLKRIEYLRYPDMITPETKGDAYLFLKGFHEALDDQLASAGDMEQLIRQTTKSAKSEHSQRHLRRPEAA
jgi:hypothetical protein